MVMAGLSVMWVLLIGLSVAWMVKPEQPRTDFWVGFGCLAVSCVASVWLIWAVVS